MKGYEQKIAIIENYIDAYNRFDVENMLRDLSDRIVFRNVSGGDLNLTTSGIEEFRAQAEHSKNLFAQREQKIIDWKFGEDAIEVEVDYRGTLAGDLPNGLKKGDEIAIEGKSVFRFDGDKIIEIEDLS